MNLESLNQKNKRKSYKYYILHYPKESKKTKLPLMLNIKLYKTLIYVTYLLIPISGLLQLQRGMNLKSMVNKVNVLEYLISSPIAFIQRLP